MSALWAPVSDRPNDDRPDDDQVVGERARLRAVPRSAPRMARFPFLLVLMGVFGLGMAGLLMLNTTLQAQAFQSRNLTRQVTELAYTQADLENQLTVAAAPQELARRASAMGMRTNPYPALLVVPGGKVLGKATRVKGTEMKSQIVKTPAEIAADAAAAAAKKQAAAAKKAAEEKAKALAAQQKAAADRLAALAAMTPTERAAALKAEAEQQAAAKKQAAAQAEADAKKKTVATNGGQG